MYKTRIVFKSPASCKITEGILSWLKGNGPLDIRKVRDQFHSDSVPGCLYNGVSLSKQAISPTLFSILKFGIFEDDILNVVESQQRLNFTEYDIDALVEVLSHLVATGDIRAQRAISVITNELNKPDRFRDIRRIDNPGVLDRLLAVMSELKPSHVPIISLCLDCLVLMVGRMEPRLIISILSSMSRSSFKHPTFTESVIFVLPVVPCTDDQLREIVRLLLHIGLDNTQDTQFISNLVKFRAVSIIE